MDDATPVLKPAAKPAPRLPRKGGRWLAVAAAGLLLYAYAPSGALGQTEPTVNETDDPSWWEALLRGFFDWIIGFVLGVGETVLDWMLEAIPPGGRPDLSTAAYYLGIADNVVNVPTILSLAAAYLAFVAVFFMVKMVLKLIPGIG